MAATHRSKINKGTMAHIFIGLFFSIYKNLILYSETIIAIADQRLRELE